MVCGNWSHPCALAIFIKTQGYSKAIAFELDSQALAGKDRKENPQASDRIV
jgi:hypothetical protein